MAMTYVKLFFDWPDITAPLTLEEKGRLIDVVMLYAREGKGEESLTGNERFVFPMLKARVVRTAEKYAAVCKQNSDAHAYACLKKEVRTEEVRTEEPRTEDVRTEEEDRSPNQEPPVLKKKDDNWRSSSRARAATAQIVVDQCISEKLPCRGAKNLFDVILEAMEAGVSPEEILGCCRRSDEMSLGFELYEAMKGRK